MSVESGRSIVSPTLIEVRDRFTSRSANAEETASDLLDEELVKRPDDQPLVKFESGLHAVDIENRDQLRTVVATLEERIGELLDQGHRVRII